MNGPRSLIVLMAVALMIVPSTGCLDAQTWKTLINGPEKTRVGYREIDGPSAYVSYDITAQEIVDWISDGNPNDPPTDKLIETGFKVKEGSTRLTVSFNLSMSNPPETYWEFLEEYLNDTDYGDYFQMFKDMDRHLTVTLEDPHGLVMVNESYSETTADDVQRFVMFPEPGSWNLVIESRGIGGTFPTDLGDVEYHDEYYVWSSVRERYTY